MWGEERRLTEISTSACENEAGNLMGPVKAGEVGITWRNVFQTQVRVKMKEGDVHLSSQPASWCSVQALGASPWPS